MTENTESRTAEFVPSPEYLARARRVEDAMALRQPDRAPILLGLSYLMAEMGNVTRQELYDNPAKYQEIL